VEDRADRDVLPFESLASLGKMYELFGDQMDSLIDELNGELVA
jgi:type I restriction enzyme, R subunit